MVTQQHNTIETKRTTKSKVFLCVTVNPEPVPQPAQFLGKIWPGRMTKQEQQDIGMMPPPDTSMIPLRRSSTHLTTASSDSNSPPLRSLKQEILDDNSQNSILDPTELRSSVRYRHLSESSLDVHPGESNLSLMNDASQTNISESSNQSLINENSADYMMPQESISRPMTICDSSLDVNVSNSNMSLNDDSNCSSVMSQKNPHVNDLKVFTQGCILNTVMSTSSSCDEGKVIDLRTKMSLGTVADLVSTNAPSMATLESFGVTEASNMPLPAQSAQSVENYLTKIEANKQNLKGNAALESMATQSKFMDIKLEGGQDFYTQKMLNVQVLPLCGGGLNENQTQVSVNVNCMEPVFISTQQSLLTTKARQAEVLSTVAKSEAAALAEQLKNQNSVITTVVNNMVASIEGDVLSPQIIPDKLNILVNCGVDARIINQNETNKMQQQSNLIMNSPHGVLLNSPSALVIPSVVDPALSSNILQRGVLASAHVSPSLSPEVILNSQISPSLMCQNSVQRDSLLTTGAMGNMCHSGVQIDNDLLRRSLNAQQGMPGLLSPMTQSSLVTSLSQPTAALPPNNQVPSEGLGVMPALSSPQVVNAINLVEPEKAIILNAAVDLLETHKQLNKLGHQQPLETKQIEQHLIDDILSPNNAGSDLMPAPSLGQLSNAAYIQSQFVTTSNIMPTKTAATHNEKNEYILSMNQQEKKNDDRMIPQSFATMTENELINIINPSCFDQGNNFH